MKKLGKIFGLFSMMLILLLNSLTAFAHDFNNLPDGTYEVDAELSCYINAMGGVEFGKPLLTSAKINVSDSNKTITLYLTKSQVTIYSVTCDTFIDAAPSNVAEEGSVKSGTIGYYDENGKLQTENVSYKLSDDTAENAKQEQVHYVESITFPLISESETYGLSLFINSNVMGTQFSADKYPATITVDWDGLYSSLKSTGTTAASTATTQPTTEKSSQGDVSSLDGLNIYSGNTEEVRTDESEAPEVYLNRPLVIVVVTVAAILIITGIALVIAGKKEKSNGKN